MEDADHAFEEESGGVFCGVALRVYWRCIVRSVWADVLYDVNGHEVDGLVEGGEGLRGGKELGLRFVALDVSSCISGLCVYNRYWMHAHGARARSALHARSV